MEEALGQSFRRIEIASIVIFATLVAVLCSKIAPLAGEHPFLGVAAVFAGYVGADFASGFVHWIGDTWGTFKTPLIGSVLIRPFREHHSDPEGITRHDFVETNGANCLISIPVALLALAIPASGGPLQLFASASLGSLIVWVFGTNQFHKWAHSERRPAAVRALQRLHLILPPEHHAVHHAPPFTTYYCITMGWLNWPLSKLGFFPILERTIQRLSGVLPRQDAIDRRIE